LQVAGQGPRQGVDHYGASRYRLEGSRGAAVEAEEEIIVKCPHCLTDFHDHWHLTWLQWPEAVTTLEDADGHWSVMATKCPACTRTTIKLRTIRSNYIVREPQVWPKGIARAPLPAEVKDPFRTDYLEACNTLDGSPRASAAMSRFCLQRLLRDKAGVKPADLSKEIDQVLASKALPSDLAEDLDAIRAIGNFGAHPIKSKNTGEIVEVAPGEAEHLLTVLEELFDFYFVRPAERAAKRDEINKKLADAGKPPLKTPPK
jgi:Domain of unknown function (DUF4145)